MLPFEEAERMASGNIISVNVFWAKQIQRGQHADYKVNNMLTHNNSCICYHIHESTSDRQENGDKCPDQQYYYNLKECHPDDNKEVTGGT